MLRVRRIAGAFEHEVTRNGQRVGRTFYFFRPTATEKQYQVIPGGIFRSLHYAARAVLKTTKAEGRDP